MFISFIFFNISFFFFYLFSFFFIIIVIFFIFVFFIFILSLFIVSFFYFHSLWFIRKRIEIMSSRIFYCTNRKRKHATGSRFMSLMSFFPPLCKIYSKGVDSSNSMNKIYSRDEEFSLHPKSV